MFPSVVFWSNSIANVQCEMIDATKKLTGIKNNTWKTAQSLEALLDLKIWLLVAIQIAMQIANGGLQGVRSVPIFFSVLLPGYYSLEL